MCPEFIVGLKSETDHSQLREKMNEWIGNGCLLAWLINLDEQEVEIYRPHKNAERLKGFETKLSGEEILPGFELDLTILKS